MQYQQTPGGLQTLYDLPIAAQPQAMALLGQQQDADQLVSQDNQRQFAYDTANDPLKLREKDLANQTTLAELPYHQARSSMEQRKNSNEALTNDATIKDMLGKYSSAEMQRHVGDAENMGTRLSQMGEEAFSNPLGASARVKAELQSMGMGHLWNPDWENSDPGVLARQLGDYGTDLQQTSAKFRSAMQLQDMKNSAVQYTADQRVHAAEIAAAQRQATAQALMDTKKHIATIPKGLEDFAAKMRQLAMQATTADEKKAYMEQAVWAEEQKARIAAAPAQVNTGVKPFLPGVGIQDNNAGRVSPGLVEGNGTPTPPMIGAQGAPTPQAVEFLKTNPHLREQFDAKYGPGSAAKVLGQ